MKLLLPNLSEDFTVDKILEDTFYLLSGQNLGRYLSPSDNNEYTIGILDCLLPMPPFSPMLFDIIALYFISSYERRSKPPNTSANRYMLDFAVLIVALIPIVISMLIRIPLALILTPIFAPIIGIFSAIAKCFSRGGDSAGNDSQQPNLITEFFSDITTLCNTLNSTLPPVTRAVVRNDSFDGYDYLTDPLHNDIWSNNDTTPHHH